LMNADGPIRQRPVPPANVLRKLRRECPFIGSAPYRAMALRKKSSTRGPDWTAGRENENLGCE